MKKLCLFLFTCLLLLAGCTNNIQTMLDDYNENFAIVNTAALPLPGDENFDESQMLMTEYYVALDDTLTLSAPFNCSSYDWVVTDPQDNNNVVDIVMYGEYNGFQREFVTYIPESGLKVGRTYRLTLTVTDADGNLYKDTCGLVIYKHYNFDAEIINNMIIDNSRDTNDTEEDSII